MTDNRNLQNNGYEEYKINDSRPERKADNGSDVGMKAEN